MKWYYILLIILASLVLLDYIIANLTYRFTLVRGKSVKSCPKWLFKLLAGEAEGFDENFKKYSSLIEECYNREYSIKDDYGNKLVGDLYTPSELNDKNTMIIFAHGWKGNPSLDFATCAAFFLEHGYEVLVINHVAHGKSEGKYIGFGWVDAINLAKWINFMDSERNGKTNFIIHGVSMGGGAVLNTLRYDLPSSLKGCISDCAFTSLSDEISFLSHRFKLPTLMIRFVISRRIKKHNHFSLNASTIDALKETHVPVLFIHGDGDTFVPVEHSYRNYDACVSSKTLKIFEGSNHAQCHMDNSKEYETICFEFIDSVL